MSGHARSVEELLASAGWLQGLARELVGEAGGEDLAQEALLVGLQRERGVNVPLPRWLASVLRNRARDGWRAESRRRAREVATARPEAQAGPDELLARFEAQRSVAEAVRALAEPYRTTILLRYFEGLPPRKIAERTGDPVRTVGTRLQRGLELLRGELDRRHGNRSTWLGALLPWVKRAELGRAAGAGVLILKAKAIGALVLASAALLGGYGWWKLQALTPEREPSAPPEVPIATLPVAVQELALDPDREPAESAAEGDRAALDPLREAFEAAFGPSQPARELKGRVVDLQGAPLSGVRIVATPTDGAAEPSSVTRSDAEGRFRLLYAAVRGPVRADDPDYATVMQAHAYQQDPEWLELVVVAAPAITLAGVVRDPFGAPWPGAEVALVVQGLELGPGLVLDRSELVAPRAVADAEGAFDLGPVPATPSLQLNARAEGAQEGAFDLPGVADRGLTLVLEHAQTVSGFPGLVLDAEGAPVAGASVRCRGHQTESAEDGSFTLPEDVVLGAREVVACKTGFQAGVSPLLDPSGTQRVGPPVVVRLGPPTLCIRGRVVDGSGRPLPGIEVRALGLAWIGERDEQGEPILWSGIRLEDFSTVASDLDDSDLDWSESDPAPLYTQNDTDSEGRFVLGGLSQKSYVLGLLERESLLYLESRPIAAGSLDVEIRFAPPEGSRRIAGRVVDRKGAPVSRASLRFLREIARPVSVGPADLRPQPETSQTFLNTDEQGRFDLPALSAAVTRVDVGFDNDLEYTYALEPQGDLLDLELVAYRRAHFRIDAPSFGGADEFELLDARGQRLQIVQYQGNMAWGRHRWPLGDQGAALTALDAATTLVLYQGGAEVGRIPLELIPGEVTVVRP